jgi:hypothetical protein
MTGDVIKPDNQPKFGNISNQLSDAMKPIFDFRGHERGIGRVAIGDAAANDTALFVHGRRGNRESVDKGRTQFSLRGWEACQGV